MDQLKYQLKEAIGHSKMMSRQNSSSRQSDDGGVGKYHIFSLDYEISEKDRTSYPNN